LTSNEYVIQDVSFLKVLDVTPPAVPASSPELLLYSDPLMATIFPLAVTVFVPLSNEP
jgi:hypothetical protein